MSKRGQSKRLGPVEVLVVVIVFLFVLAIAGSASQKSRFNAYRIQCENNLSKIGKAMQIYTNDYDGKFPKSGGRNSTWTLMIIDWMATSRYEAFGLARDGSGGQTTISSCFYLLVKYMEVASKTFVCPGDAAATTFNLANIDAGSKRLIDLWDFGSTPGAHCSYAYHMPFGLYSLTTSNDPGVAVAADRNPWMSSLGRVPKTYPGQFNPEGGRASVKEGNSMAHWEEGQNVLFLDGHVSFEESSCCGVHNDNIYTFWDGGDIRIGSPPVACVSEPQDRIDTLLVNEPGIYKATTVRQPRSVNSNELKHTTIVATLESPMPEHKNVIWCGTFQIAWDKFKNDIIQEPVDLIDVQELDDRLNRGEFSPGNLEADSFYATAGFVKDGIIEEIHKEMTRRFPSEPAPVFDKRYRTLPEVSVAYAFLSVDAGFKYPFYTRNRKFTFLDSQGIRTDVTSFCDDAEVSDPNTKNVREQVEILHSISAQPGDAANFSLDLCKHTNPYQVVLARVPWRGTLGETLNDVQKYIAEFKQDPQYDILRNLRPIDSLIVPDVLYKLTHHFKELEGKPLANPKWRERDYFIFEARQMVHFSLSRTGVILKSEAALGAAGGMPPRVKQPRYFHFDRPFLIYVKKRGAEYSPFFVMWVDNCELMEKF
ncbi:MAG: hypothetical protein JXM79_18450 [Sedimentisphaerales bacterium]|nr:hypothetical protein [Sedimentisphaerales bacterium]